MRTFDYYKVTSVAQAVSLLSKHQQKAAILAGGTDLLGMMKDRLEGPKLKMPEFLIDIKGIKDLSYIKEHKNGLKIGAGTPLSEIVSSDLIGQKYPLLRQAASHVGVPQIRNVGTLGEISVRGRVVGISVGSYSKTVSAREEITATHSAGRTAITPSSAAPIATWSFPRTWPQPSLPSMPG